MESKFDVRDRVVLITGATGYLGTVMAHGLAAAGARVLVNSRNAERAEQLVAEISAAGGNAAALVFDINDAPSRREALDKVRRSHARLDVLINNAAATAHGAGFLEHYRVAVEAPAELIAESLDLLELAALRNAGGASVITVSSMYGFVSPHPGIYEGNVPPSPLTYGPSKAAQLQLTRHLAAIHGVRRIRFNSLSPGPFPNDAVQAANPEFIDRLAERNPLGRIGRPEELIGPLLFLASDASSYVTGANIAVDGGWTAW